MWLSEDNVTNDLRSIKAMELQKSFSRFISNEWLTSTPTNFDEEEKSSVIRYLKSFQLINYHIFDCFKQPLFIAKFNRLIDEMDKINNLLRDISILDYYNADLPDYKVRKEKYYKNLGTYRILRHDVLDLMTEVLYELRKDLELY